MSQEVSELSGSFSTRKTLNVTLLGGQWASSADGLSILNRELAIHLSKHPEVKVSFLVPEGSCTDDDKREAQSYGITIVDAKECPGYDRLDWLSFPPQNLIMDVIVGHGVKIGRQGHVIRDISAHFHSCKWVQVVHTAPEDLSRYKGYPDPILKGEREHEAEVELWKLADLVVPVGPMLEEAYSSCLRQCKEDQDVFSLTPGLFEREFGDLDQAPNDNSEFKVLLFGRGDDWDFELRGYNIAAKAFTDDRLKGKPYCLFFVGVPFGKQEEVSEKLLLFGIAKEQLIIRGFPKSKEVIKHLLCEVDLAILPSKSAGFGLASLSLEALSAGLPILVGSKSGFAEALENVPFGKSCIVDSDDPTAWAEAIEGVRVRHKLRLEEIKALRRSYEKTYSWKEQCDALVDKMWRMVHGMGFNYNNLVFLFQMQLRNVRTMCYCL